MAPAYETRTPHQAPVLSLKAKKMARDVPTTSGNIHRSQPEESPMSNSDLDRLTVLGGGVLGGQIAWHSAHRGKTVTVYDPSYLASENEVQSALRPYDGYTSLGAGGTYTIDSGLALTAGAAYYWLGDAEVSENGVASSFDDNKAVALSFSVGYSF